MNRLVFRIGSLGDSLISLPALAKIKHEEANQTLLTNIPVNTQGKAVSASAVYDLIGLFNNYLPYPIAGGALTFLKLALKIRKSRFDELIYLMPSRNKLQLFRDYIFFRLICGIKSIKGMQWSKEWQNVSSINSTSFEHEGSRLKRLIDLSCNPLDWKALSPEAKLNVLPVRAFESPYVVVSLGTKSWVNDWEDSNWADFLRKLSYEYPYLSLVFIGSKDESSRCDTLSSNWKGAVKNVCGDFSILQSLQILKASVLYIGHDSGPIHLAAAADVPIVGIYSSRNPKGKWFPLSDKATIFYNDISCKGCQLSNDCPKSKACIFSITTEDVLQAAKEKLNGPCF